MPAVKASKKNRSRNARILVVDDAETMRDYVVNVLEALGFEVDTASDGASALGLIESGAEPDAVLLDIMMPGMDGIEVLRKIREEDALLPVIMLSVVGSAESIVEAMQYGATDYVTKPFEDAELEKVLRRALEKHALRAERDGLRRAVGESPDAVVWRSPAMQEIKEMLDQIAETDVTVLIQGESGVGKEVVARAVHERSTRKQKPFVKVNCAALPEDLLESELFGYEQGAFTGAVSRKQGKFELADGGTMFLDEIGEMSPGLQAKLLHVLQEHRFSRLGGHAEISVDVRVVCATHRPLVAMVANNEFREDLYFRLNVVSILIPPLRDRPEERGQLIEQFLHRYSTLYDRPLPQLSRALRDAFDGYEFPGNIRELENMIKRIVVLESEESVLGELRRRESGEATRRFDFDALLDEIEATAGDVPLRDVGRRAAFEAERETIGLALDHTHWNRKQAAKLLKVSYKTLLQKIRECELEAEI